MVKVKTLIQKYIHPFLILCMILIIFAGITIIYNNRQDYASEAWVNECLREYGSGLTELDLNILSKELSAEMDKKIGELEIKKDTGLTQDQLMNLMSLVSDKLQYTAYCTSQKEIAAMSADIAKRFISENISAEYATSHKLEESVDKLEKQISEIRTAIERLEEKNIYTYSEQQIREIAKDAGMDEAEVRRWIREMYPDSDLPDYEPAIKELAEQLGVNEGTLETLIEQSKDAKDSMDYLLKRLGITEEKLNNALNQIKTPDSGELSELLAKLKTAETDLQSQIINNMSLTTNSITSVQNQVINNRNATDAAIALNKTETDRQISENKKYTDTSIEELQDNVLFYEYDESANTLKLFRKPEGGSNQ